MKLYITFLILLCSIFYLNAYPYRGIKQLIRDTPISLNFSQWQTLALQVSIEWIEKFHEGVTVPEFQAIYHQFFNVNGTYSIFLGTFSGIINALAYQLDPLRKAPGGALPIAHTTIQSDGIGSKWINDVNDNLPILVLPYIVNISISFFGQNFSGQGFIFKAYIKFLPNFISSGVYSSNMNGTIFNEYDQADVSEIILTTESTMSISPSQICLALLGNPNATDGNTTGVCPSTSIFPHYNNYDECFSYMNFVFLNNENVCPNDQTSNTTSCYWIHTLTAQFLPEIHCQHTQPNSAVCTFKCLPTCSSQNLGSNGHCEGEFNPPLGQQTFVAKCNNGYTGIPPNCVPNNCTRDADCRFRDRGNGNDRHGISSPNSISCVNNLCQCNPTFTWNNTIQALSDKVACACDEAHDLDLLWNRTDPENPIAVCIQKGRCFQLTDCRNVVSDLDTVDCIAYGENIFLPPGLLTCVCKLQNGYKGLPGNDCVCPDGNFEVNYRINGNRQQYCLSSNQCVKDKDCHDQGFIGEMCSENATGNIGFCLMS